MGVLETWVLVVEEQLAGVGLPPLAQLLAGAVALLLVIVAWAAAHSLRIGGKLAKERARHKLQLQQVLEDGERASRQLALFEQQALQQHQHLRALLLEANMPLADEDHGPAVAPPVSPFVSPFVSIDALWQQQAAAMAELVGRLQHSQAEVKGWEERAGQHKRRADQLELGRLSLMDELNRASQQARQWQQQCALRAEELASATGALRQQEAQLQAGQHQLQQLQAAEQTHHSQLAGLQRQLDQATQALASATDHNLRLQAELDGRGQPQQAAAAAAQPAETEGQHSIIAELERGQRQALEELQLAKRTIAELTARLQNPATPPPAAADKPSGVQKQPDTTEKTAARFLGQWLGLAKPAAPTSHAASPPQPQDPALTPELLAAKERAIAELTAELVAQQNHIARLEEMAADWQNREPPGQAADAPQADKPASPAHFLGGLFAKAIAAQGLAVGQSASAPAPVASDGPTAPAPEPDHWRPMRAWWQNIAAKARHR